LLAARRRASRAFENENEPPTLSLDSGLAKITRERERAFKSSSDLPICSIFISGGRPTEIVTITAENVRFSFRDNDKVMFISYPLTRKAVNRTIFSSQISSAYIFTRH